MRTGLVRALVALCGLAAVVGVSARADAQITKIVSPGPLSKAHANLEGATACQKCHDIAKGVSAQRCLACHKPIAERIAAGKGVHKSASGGCSKCHVEHRGVDHDIRQIDPGKFDHARDAGFALEGRHQQVASTCVKCHKTRSFLALRPVCSSCHTDPHNGRLGATCATCHPMDATFKSAKTAFDHSKAAFSLTGAHRTVECAKCHLTREYRGVKSAMCSDCHRDPHRAAFGPACTSCHADQAWKTTKVNHAATAFPLTGKHQTVACTSCHKAPDHVVGVKVSFAKCADCHADAHKGQFKEDCSACHKETGFTKAPFDHKARTPFELTGRHAELACVKCHTTATVEAGAKPAQVSFKGLSSACASCHKDPHAGQVSAKCETCHATSSFRIPSFTHARAADFFGGQHAAVPCVKCHAPLSTAPPEKARVTDGGWTFSGLTTRCADCHRDVHLGQVGDRCETCHAVSAAKFAAVGFSHERAAFALTGRHKALECAKCHRQETGAFPGGAGTAVRLKGVGTLCASCHRDIHLGQLGAQCERCHTSASFKKETYTHAGAQAFFGGKHAGKPCAACHKEKEGTFPAGTGAAVRYSGGGFGRACTTCHTDQHNRSLGGSCESCHDPAGWKVVSRAFHKDTVFPLEGKHLGVPCASCHLNGVTAGTPTRCYDCHWARRQDDPYQTRLGVQCDNCHTPTSWTAVRWNHAAATGLALNGAHRTLACDACHKGGVFTAAQAQCSSCHLTDYQAAKNPNHVSAGFPTACDACHRPSDVTFAGATFNHNASFALVGVHATQPCASCHRNNVYAGTPSTCYACHQADYQKAQNPNHVSAGIPTACDACHRPTDPTFAAGGTFNHNATFALVGTHATQPCAACHKNNVYAGTPATCYACHQADYQKAQNPNHVSAGFPTTCDACHRATDPSFAAGGSFNHNATFALVGVHATQPCAACHKNNVYPGTPTACYGCHQADYQRAQNPNHVAGGYSTSCETCHRATDSSFAAASFNHSTVFALVGVHATQPCTACHKNNVYPGTPTACYGCHQANYQQAQNPNHVAAGYSTSCETCHRPTDPSFASGTFNHGAVFALVGVHATQPCTACHKNNVYAGTPTACYGCHQADYQSAQNPNHVSAGFPTTCDSCHRATDATFQAGTFTHGTYALVGVHATQPCSACHKNGVYAGTPRICYGCHQVNYQQAQNPNHIGAGFSTTCDQCHLPTDTTWLLGRYNHTAFPITSGRHVNLACSACHNDPSNYKVFTCLTCHDRATTDAHHVGRSGYRYDSNACYSCHPQGRAG